MQPRVLKPWLVTVVREGRRLLGGKPAFGIFQTCLPGGRGQIPMIGGGLPAALVHFGGLGARGPGKFREM